MIKYKHKLLTLLSVLAIGAGTAGVAVSAPATVASADETTYAISNVLSVGNAASLGADSYENKTFAAMTFYNGSTVSYKQDLAYKWYTEEGVKYFETEFAFSSANFEEFTMKFESSPNSKTKDDKAENFIVFTVENGAIKASVNGESKVDVAVGSTVKIAFANKVNDASGEYDVNINGSYAGCFTNVGGYFAEYSATTVTPLTFSAKLDDSNVENNLKVFFLSLNNQSFEMNSDNRVTDNAAPVLVVNQDVKAFRLGSAFSLKYEVIDVLDSTVTKTLEYFQYEEGKSVEYGALNSSTYFFETQSTYEKYGQEFVSIKFTLKDDAAHEVNYDLAWYCDAENITTFDGVDYISVTIDTESPVYTCVDTNGTESILDEDNEAYLAYQEAVEEAAKGIQAGSGHYFYLPSLSDLIVDNDTAYTSLVFSIYYKTQSSSSSNSNVGRLSDNLEIEVATAGIYSFRVVASDVSGNGMKFYYHDRLVDVDSSNVWSLDCIPEFTFTVYNYGASVGEAEKEATGYVNQSYRFSDFDIKALSGYAQTYTLYYFEGAYEKFTYAELIAMANGEGFEKYVAGADGLKLNKIEKFDSSIDEEENEEKWNESDNPYAWYGDGDSFIPQQQGFYVLKLEVVDAELWGEKIVAYKVIEVESEEDVMYGETYWLRDNYLTVIFFGIAILGVIGIVIVLLIKPKDENIEDIEVETLTKKKKN